MELKPCPFCGKKAKLYVSDDGVAVVCTGWYQNGCGCRTIFYKDWSIVHGLDDWRNGKTAVEMAVEAWNRRANDGQADVPQH